MDLQKLLDQAAEVFGIESEYWDISGRHHVTSAELKRAILTSLRVPCDSPESLERALSARNLAEWSAVGPAVHVGTQGEPLSIPVNLPATGSILKLAAVVSRESGAQAHLDLDLSSTPVTDRISIDGHQFERRNITLPLTVDPGYHDIHWELNGNVDGHTRLIVCPPRAWLPESLARGDRRAGLAVSLYGIHSQRTWGCGDFTALRTLIDWGVDHLGLSYIAVNPLQAIHNRSPFNTSPYLPNSIFYRNFIYIDIDAVEDLAHSPAAQALRRDPATIARIQQLNQTEDVEYEQVAALKLQFLNLLFERFAAEELPAVSIRARDFNFYVEAEGDLLDRFALYSVLDAHFHQADPNVWVWTQWPAPFHDPESPEVQAFRRERQRDVLFFKYVQWLIDQQARQAQQHARSRGMEVGIFHDLPLATDNVGFELWANRRFYVAGCRVGAPPDDFAPAGQDWSFPPPNTDEHRRDGYRLFAQSVAKAARHGGALRLDHVMRLFRLYWIPEGFNATQGAYVRDHAAELLGILALESHRNQVLIVGEDLGTVEPSMREALARRGILSYRLFYFEKNPSGGFKTPAEYPSQALVSSTTHDLPTLAGFWAGRDIETRYRLGVLGDESAFRNSLQGRAEDKRQMFRALGEAGLLPSGYPPEAAAGPVLSGELHFAITGFLASTPCLLMTLNQEDLTKELDQQNLPGTTWQYPNWRRKMKFSLEDLLESGAVRDYTQMLDYWLRRSGRRQPAH